MFGLLQGSKFEHPKFLADGKVNPLAAISDFVLVFIDDILIFSKTAEEHIEHVQNCHGRTAPELYTGTGRSIQHCAILQQLCTNAQQQTGSRVAG